jgi:hypothetical protein
MLAHSGDIPRFCEFQPEFAPFGDGQLVGHRLARELFENPRGGSALGDPPTQIDGGVPRLRTPPPRCVRPGRGPKRPNSCVIPFADGTLFRRGGGPLGGVHLGATNEGGPPGVQIRLLARSSHTTKSYYRHLRQRRFLGPPVALSVRVCWASAYQRKSALQKSRSPKR